MQQFARFQGPENLPGCLDSREQVAERLIFRLLEIDPTSSSATFQIVVAFQNKELPVKMPGMVVAALGANLSFSVRRQEHKAASLHRHVIVAVANMLSQTTEEYVCLQGLGARWCRSIAEAPEWVHQASTTISYGGALSHSC